MNHNVSPIVKLAPTSNSYPFERKQFTLPQKVRFPLEAQSDDPASSSNGAFPNGSLSLSSPHAEIWIQGKQILIRDRSSTFGTYVNGIRIQQQTLLQNGDIVTLGQQIPRTPATSKSISDSQLKPIEATVTFIGL